MIIEQLHSATVWELSDRSDHTVVIYFSGPRAYDQGPWLSWKRRRLHLIVHDLAFSSSFPSSGENDAEED